ncbi:MAG: hypothetical protein K2X76_06220 [Sphingomonas sp.]|nr:hypothetical protein [Sphingomonas sp.]
MADEVAGCHEVDLADRLILLRWEAIHPRPIGRGARERQLKRVRRVDHGPHRANHGTIITALNTPASGIRAQMIGKNLRVMKHSFRWRERRSSLV